MGRTLYLKDKTNFKLKQCKQAVLKWVKHFFYSKYTMAFKAYLPQCFIFFCCLSLGKINMHYGYQSIYSTRQIKCNKTHFTTIIHIFILIDIVNMYDRCPSYSIGKQWIQTPLLLLCFSDRYLDILNFYYTSISVLLYLIYIWMQNGTFHWAF